MASRTPEQLAFVLGSINKIADPNARLAALRDLESETVQGEAAASNIPAVDKALGGAGVVQPAAYTALLGSIRQSASEANAAAQKAVPPGQTPDQARITGTTAQKDQGILDEMKANQAAGKGFKTNAQVDADAIAQGHLQAAQDQVGLGQARLGLGQQQVDIANGRLGLSEQNAALVARQAQIRDDLAQHKIELTTAMDQLREIQVEQQALIRDQTNTVNLYGHQVAEHGNAESAATADQNAADTLIDSQKLMPAGAVTNGGGFNIKANAVPASQYSDMATFIANQVANARAARVGPAPVAPTLTPFTAPPLPVIPSAVATVTPPPAPQFTAPASSGGPPPSYGTANSPVAVGGA